MTEENTVCCDDCSLRGTDGCWPGTAMACKHPNAEDMGYIISWNKGCTGRFSTKCPKQGGKK
jgi:hypothetical protein